MLLHKLTLVEWFIRILPVHVSNILETYASLWTSRKLSLFKFQQHIFPGARKVYFPDLSKEMFLEVQMKNVVQFDVYLDILRVGSICVTTYLLFKENPHPSNPIIQA